MYLVEKQFHWMTRVGSVKVRLSQTERLVAEWEGWACAVKLASAAGFCVPREELGE